MPSASTDIPRGVRRGLIPASLLPVPIPGRVPLRTGPSPLATPACPSKWPLSIRCTTCSTAVISSGRAASNRRSPIGNDSARPAITDLMVAAAEAAGNGGRTSSAPSRSSGAKTRSRSRSTWPWSTGASWAGRSQAAQSAQILAGPGPGDEAALALVADDQAIAPQVAEGLADGYPADLELRVEDGLRRHAALRRMDTLVNARAQMVGDPRMQREVGNDRVGGGAAGSGGGSTT